MSSIDKDMQDIACGYDRRVRVRNTSVSKSYDGCDGYIKFYIGSECILSIKDRYGYISDYEKEQIRRAIQNYQSHERDEERRAAEAERRRREEEERRRREEEERRRRAEAERVAAYNKLVTSVGTAKRQVEAAYSAVTQIERELKIQTESIKKELSAAKFDVASVRERLRHLDSKRQSTLNALTAERTGKLEKISRFEGVQNSLTTDRYNQLQKELSAVGATLSSASFDSGEIESMSAYVKQLVAAQQRLSELRGQFEKDAALGGASAEIAKIALRQIDGLDTSSLEQIETAFARLDEARGRIEQCNDYTEIYRITEELKNAPASVHAESQFTPRQSTYRHIDYATQCAEAAEELRRWYDSLKGKEYSTATQGELERVERALQQFACGMSGKSQLDSIASMTDLLRIIDADDRLFGEIFADYDRLKKDLEKVGATAERLDALNYNAQRQRMLETLYRRRAEIEMDQDKESAEDKRCMLSFGVRSAFAEQGLYFVTGRVSECERAEELVFALAGVADAVIKAEITEDSLHWYVCGTRREDGNEASAERVLEIMKAFDRSGAPQKILNSLSQTLKIQTGEITAAIDCTSEGALQRIVENGVFSLSQELVSEDGGTVTAGEIMRRIAEAFPQERERNAAVYANGVKKGNTKISNAQDRLAKLDARVYDKKTSAVRSRDSRAKPKQQQANGLRVRYMR